MPSNDRTFNARPDSLDFRDKIYVANLYEVPPHISLEEYLKYEVPVLNQGQEGACTGFGLATVANYLLCRRQVSPDRNAVSPRMLYEMAKRYDEWPGEDYSGSSARGAMKGWHKHGVCDENCWPCTTNTPDERLTNERTSDALKRPLGAYYRVNHRDLVAMHSAMAEVGILYATCLVHEGWQQVGSDGQIHYSDHRLGGHAFAIVAYDKKGFWIQNSWGTDWGRQGFAQISYDDWLANGTDVWVARLGAPVILLSAQSIASSHAAGAGKSRAYAYSDLRPHIISLGNDGQLKAGGDFGTSQQEVKTLFAEDFKRITQNWKKKRILLYAHGGLVDETSAVQRLAEYRAVMLENEVYPISFIWHSDFWSTATNILEEALRRRKPEGFLDASLDFMLDRLDDALEVVARSLMGKAQWDEMKENALAATENESGGARLALKYLSELVKQEPAIEIHVVGHSAGSIFLAPLVRLLTAPEEKITEGYLKGKSGYGIPITTCTLWAPACTIDLFKKAYIPAIEKKGINKFALFTLTDDAEQKDHCAHIYNKSLLYLVSNAFEKVPKYYVFSQGEAILGMQKWVVQDEEVQKIFNTKAGDWILSPNSNEPILENYSSSHTHGGFDDDKPTVVATLARILTASESEADAIEIKARLYRLLGDSSPRTLLHFNPSANVFKQERKNLKL
ncbi:peptidase C1 [Siphonobacter sp. SORGH_AS_0500]|uniref:C1 family peptidase n=1 Tax=Siphonobacter sp. SORGH_AS_0500 TaxID=1864824 RepID=UPI000CC23D5B|nr:C1 family peptidase [Siphonobacter sp. SORGH_AS_0500]PKK37417.1 peptidase C1 [Siphonobacter sp. SORGH_AS_0500]